MAINNSVSLMAGWSRAFGRVYSKRAYQWLLYRLLEAVFLCLLGLLKMLPRGLFRRLSSPFLTLFISLVVPKRRILRNVGAAFGHSFSDATKIGLAKGVQEHFVKNLLDCFLQLVHPATPGRW